MTVLFGWSSSFALWSLGLFTVFWFSHGWILCIYSFNMFTIHIHNESHDSKGVPTVRRKLESRKQQEPLHASPCRIILTNYWLHRQLQWCNMLKFVTESELSEVKSVHAMYPNLLIFEGPFVGLCNLLQIGLCSWLPSLSSHVVRRHPRRQGIDAQCQRGGVGRLGRH